MKALAANPKERTKFAAPVAAAVPDELELSLRHLQAELSRVDALIRLAVARWQAAGRDPYDAFRGLVVSDQEAGETAAQSFGADWVNLLEADDLGQEALRRQADAAAQAQAALALADQHGLRLRLPHLTTTFGLDAFALNALLLCLAPALDLRYEQLYSYLQNDVNRKRPSVNLIMQLLTGAGASRLRRLGAFAPDAPLLYHGLLAYTAEGGAPDPSPLAQPLVMDRTVVHWLLGEYHPSAEFGRHVQLMMPQAAPADLLSPQVEQTIRQAATLPNPLLICAGPDTAAQMLAAHALAARYGRPLLVAPMHHLMAAGLTAEHALRIVLRDGLLNHALVHLTGWDSCMHDRETPAHLLSLLMTHPDAVMVSSREAWQPHGHAQPRVVIGLEFGLPDYAQRRHLWRHYMHTYGLTNDQVDLLLMAGQFTLSTGQIRDAVTSAGNAALRRGGPVTQADLFAGARLHSSARLGDMARKITPRYGWDDIILPDDQIEILRELVATVRGRSKVLEEWGLGKKLASSAAVTVLFAGPPGTGKTMAAEVIALDLGLDLYKLDLSNLVSKYIGETEKNLERVFTEAQSSNAILFFDEADAIFGKRSGVKDAHDRYANLEVSYLLQRMEVYDGVTILATNLRSNLDEAFLRRLQFAVDIPFPDEKHRLRIWETLYPTSVPRASDVDFADLAKRYRLAGGNIRNVLLSAAYLAAADGGAVTMQHLLHGIRREFQKMGRLVLE